MGLILDQSVEGIECTSQYVSRRSDRSGALVCPYFVDFIYCFYIITPLFFSSFFSFISFFALFFIYFFLMILAEDREGNSILLDRVDGQIE